MPQLILLMSNPEKNLIQQLNKLCDNIDKELESSNLDEAVDKFIEWQNMTPKQRIDQFAKRYEQYKKLMNT